MPCGNRLNKYEIEMKMFKFINDFIKERSNTLNQAGVLRYIKKKRYNHNRYKYHMWPINPLIPLFNDQHDKNTKFNKMYSYAILNQINELFTDFCLSLSHGISTYEYCKIKKKSAVTTIFNSKHYIDHCILLAYPIFEFITLYFKVKYSLSSINKENNNGSIFPDFKSNYLQSGLHINEIDDFLTNIDAIYKSVQLIVKYRIDFTHNDIPIIKEYYMQHSIKYYKKLYDSKFVPLMNRNYANKEDELEFHIIIDALNDVYNLIFKFHDINMRDYLKEENVPIERSIK